jgi:hypothetical protein
MIPKQIGDYAERTQDQADEPAEIQPHNLQSDACGHSVDDADDQLATEEGDEIPVDLGQRADHLILELGRP